MGVFISCSIETKWCLDVHIDVDIDININVDIDITVDIYIDIDVDILKARNCEKIGRVMFTLHCTLYTVQCTL